MGNRAQTPRLIPCYFLHNYFGFEGSFDENNNNQWDDGEPFEDLNNDGRKSYGEPYTDKNKNNRYDPPEQNEDFKIQSHARCYARPAPTEQHWGP